MAEDTPIEVASETGGGGDDLQLLLANGEVAEAQIKKGLRAGADLDDALWALAQAVWTKGIGYGLLIVDPRSSRTISSELAGDLIRLAEDPSRVVGPLAQRFQGRLINAGLDVQSICARLRIVTVPALEGGDAALRTAIARLERVCSRADAAQAAWDRLYRDAHAMMARRGRRTRSAIADVLRSAGVVMSTDPAAGPSALLARLRAWTLDTTAAFTIVGVSKPLSMDEAWLPLSTVVRDEIAASDIPNMAAAVKRYHEGPGAAMRRDSEGCDSLTLGRFRRLAVVMAGPGSGKSTLLKHLARVYARSGFPVLRVAALSVARRMANAGETFIAAAFTLGLEGSGVSVQDALTAALGDWVLLCDGLDECGGQQQLVLEGLLQFAAAYPGARIIAATRTIGYRPATLAAWRHYDLLFLDSSSAATSVEKLLKHVLPIAEQGHLYRRVKEALEESDAGRTAARSPLMVSLCAALIARGGSFGRTRVQFYRAIFELLEAEPTARADRAPASGPVRNRFLDLLGWTLLNQPEIRTTDALAACADVLKEELRLSSLQAQDLAEPCLNYWQALGVVERVHHGSDQTLTFIHKTFGEFAAGRHLAALPAAEQARLLHAHADASAISEAIVFASGLGGGPVFLSDLVSRGFGGASGHPRLLQALEVLVESDPLLEVGTAEPILAAAIVSLEGPHQGWALETAQAVVPVASLYPSLVAEQVRGLCDSDQTWTRLSAWTVRLATGADALSLDVLFDVLDGFSSSADEDVRRLGGGILIGPSSRRDILQAFALLIAERMVDECSGAEAISRLEHFIPILNHCTIRFFQRFAQLVGEHKLPLPEMAWAKDHQLDLRKWLPQPWQNDAFAALLSAIPHEAVAESDPQDSRPLYNLAGFLEVIGMRDAPLSEIWSWRHQIAQTDVAEVYGHIAALAGLAEDSLARETAAILIDITVRDGLSALFDCTPAVDMNDLDPGRLAGRSIDFGKAERAMHHPSSLAVGPALTLVKYAGDPGIWEPMARRLLATGKDEAIWAGAELAQQLPPDQAAPILLEHIEGGTCPGSEYAVKAAAEVCPRDHPQRLAALRAALLGPDVGAAIAAAEWAKAKPRPGDAAEVQLLWQAFRHWVRAEEPSPTTGGTVPPSPRAALASALAGAEQVPLEVLFEWAADNRYDVAEAADAALVERTGKEALVRDAVVERALAGKLKPKLLERCLRDPAPYSEQNIRRLLNLLYHADPALRLRAMPLLDWPELPPEERSERLTRLRQDPEAQIRDRAIRMLG